MTVHSGVYDTLPWHLLDLKMLFGAMKRLEVRKAATTLYIQL